MSLRTGTALRGGPAQHCGPARHCGPAQHCGHCPCATNNGDSSRPPCLSAGSPLARLASQQASLPPCRALSLPLFRSPLLGAVCSAHGHVSPLSRLASASRSLCLSAGSLLPASFPSCSCLSASLVASLQGSLSAAFCGLPRCFETVCSADGHVFASRACSSRSFSVSLWL